MRFPNLAPRSLLLLSLAAYVSDSAGIAGGKLRRHTESGGGLLGNKRRSIDSCKRRRVPSPARAQQLARSPPRFRDHGTSLSASGMARTAAWIRSAVSTSGFQTALAAMAGAVACFVGTTSVRMAIRGRGSRLALYSKLAPFFQKGSSPRRSASGPTSVVPAQASLQSSMPIFAAPIKNHIALTKAGSQLASNTLTPRSVLTPRKKLVPDPADPTKWTYVPVSAAPPQAKSDAVVAVSSHGAVKAGGAQSDATTKDMPDVLACKSAHVAKSLLRLGAVAERRQQFESWRVEQEDRRKRLH